MYVVEVRGCWNARVTISPEMDRQFWMNGEFGNARRINDLIADSGWLLKEPLPLGDACHALNLWNVELMRRNGKQNSADTDLIEQGLIAGRNEAIGLLLACAEEAKREGQNDGKACGRWWQRRLGSGRKRHKAIEGEDLQGLAERWERFRDIEIGGTGHGGEMERTVSGAELGEPWREGAKRGRGGKAERAASGAELGRGGAGRGRGDRERAVSGAELGESGREGAERRRGGEAERAVSDAELGEIAAAAKAAAEVMQGRALLRSEAHALLAGAGGPGAAARWSEVLQLAALLGRVRLSGSIAAGYGGRLDAVMRRRRERSCLRCGSGEARMHRTACAACGRVCAYCTACINMGRSRECELLVTGQYNMQLREKAEPGCLSQQVMRLSFKQRLDKWSLSPAQTAAAAKALRFVEELPLKPPLLSTYKSAKARDFLLWAVTGAGKTEMIFPLVESVLLRGGKALIATPRRDVVIELDPRIRAAFPTASVVNLYGGSAQRWETGDITLATTHQLLRFYQGFDLVVIDELDAFPYHGDKILHYAADKSCAPGAARLLLSATPPSELQREAKRGRLPHARVPVRYHRHPLPVPKLIQAPAVKQMLKQYRLPPKLLAAMQASLHRGAQLFVFVQQIAQTELIAALLRAALQHSAVAATSSQDADRADKVQHFRKREIRVLVTTTILERGVTIPKSDVYILDADGRLFDEASLVQMAGRAGRSSEDPFGRVYFCSRERSRAQLSAVHHIQTMNRIARKQGYLLPIRKGGLPK